MTHIKISSGGPGVFSMTVDGVDIGKSVLADGFGIEFPEDPTYQLPVVVLRIEADVLDLDLPEALLEATVVGEEARVLRSIDTHLAVLAGGTRQAGLGKVSRR